MKQNIPVYDYIGHKLLIAKINYKGTLDSLFYDIIHKELRPPYIDDYSLYKINALANVVDDTRKIDIANKLSDKLRLLVNEYTKYYKELIKEVENI